LPLLSTTEHSPWSHGVAHRTTTTTTTTRTMSTLEMLTLETIPLLEVLTHITVSNLKIESSESVAKLRVGAMPRQNSLTTIHCLLLHSITQSLNHTTTVFS
jgi:hypothetical protein